jgi:hypothetical protein
MFLQVEHHFESNSEETLFWFMLEKLYFFVAGGVWRSY